jgi:hypothetical protein
LSYLTLFLAFQIDHLDIKINVFNRSSWLPPILNPNIIFFSFKLTVPTFKVFIKIVMFDKVKYDKIHINQNVLCNIWKQTLKSELKIWLSANCNDTIDKVKILTILSVISK